MCHNDVITAYTASFSFFILSRISTTDYNVIQNNGSAAHQAVFHVHFHIIPKFPNRGLGISWSAGSLDSARATELARKMRAEMGVG